MSWYLATNQIRRLQIELTNYCNAACPLCDRENLTKEQLNNTAISFEKIRSIITNDDWSDLNQIHLCGNYDEPTIHPDCMDIVKWLIGNTSAKTEIRIASNGGTRDESFWKELGELSDKYRVNHKDNERSRLSVIFGIDGLEDTNHIYRKNVRWDHLKRNFECYIENGGYAEWQFICFEHNIHQLDKVQTLAKKWNFKKFKVINTFRNVDQHQDDVVPADVSSKLKNKDLKEEKQRSLSRIDCKALDKESALDRSLFINHLGVVTPCCWMGTMHQMNKTKRLWKSYDTDINNINKYERMSDLLKSKFFLFLKSSIEKQYNPTCLHHCKTKGKLRSKDTYLFDSTLKS